MAGAGRVREDAIEETEPARRRAVPRDGVRASASADEDAEEDDALDALGRSPIRPVQNDGGQSSAGAGAPSGGAQSFG